MNQNCRLCGCELFSKPLIVLNNVPKAAQFLPRKEEFSNNEHIDLNLCQCSGCGLVQITNNPVEYYKEVVTSAAWSEKMCSFRTRQMKKFIDDFSLHGKKILEVGCGEGYLLDIIKTCGGLATGLEASPKAVLTGKRAGRNIIGGYIDSAFKISDQPYDAFISINFLEHAPDPNSMLRGIYHNLSREAVGVVEVPNLEKVLTNKRYYDFIADHLSYFTVDTLRFALEKNGFAVLDCYSTWEDDDIMALVKKKGTLDIELQFSEIRSLISSLRSIIDDYKHNEKKVAVWGASHQALTLLSMCKIGTGDVEYIIDSAKFKQGRYTPIGHVPIFAPEILLDNPVDIVIVMAAGYSDEVVETLFAMNLKKTTVAILKETTIELVRKEAFEI
ncbi:MAG: type 11 methyltransferase [Firmicutes bacterium]|nr:type 11 methyltransferase [Bacillota bacterium]